MKKRIIFEENFKGIDPKLLLEPENYLDVEDMVLSIGAAHSSDYAKECVLVLADKLSIIGDKLSQDLAVKYIRLLKVLRLYSLQSVKDSEKQKFFEDQIVDVFKFEEVDVQERVNMLFMSFMDARDIIENLRKTFLLGFEKNEEIIGEKNINIYKGEQKKLAKPSLKNWLIDYNSNTHIDFATNKRSGYQQVTFLTRSSNVTALNKKGKDLLVKLIQFYDWLKFDPLIYNFRLPGQPKRRERFAYFDEPRKDIPEELLALIEERRSKSLQKEETRIKSFVHKFDNTNVDFQVSNRVYREPVNDISEKIIKPVNIQNILQGKREVKKDSFFRQTKASGLAKSSVNLSKSTVQMKSKVNIDQKLAELLEEVKRRKTKKH